MRLPNHQQLPLIVTPRIGKSDLLEQTKRHKKQKPRGTPFLTLEAPSDAIRNEDRNPLNNAERTKQMPQQLPNPKIHLQDLYALCSQGNT